MISLDIYCEFLDYIPLSDKNDTLETSLTPCAHCDDWVATVLMWLEEIEERSCHKQKVYVETINRHKSQEIDPSYLYVQIWELEEL